MGMIQGLLILTFLFPASIQQEESDNFPFPLSGEIDRSTEAIRQAVAELGEEARRDAAERQLFWIGESAREALKAVSKDDSAAYFRAYRILQRLDRLRSLRDVVLRKMTPGYGLVGGKTKGIGGFGGSSNTPRKVGKEFEFKEGELQVIALPEAPAVFDKSYRGMRVLVVNAAEREADFKAQDSRLYLIQEAQDDTGTWQPVEYLSSSW